MGVVEVEGLSLPAVGLASFFLDSAEESIARFVDFLHRGGRSIELAELFSNYNLLWKALQQCELEREDLVISVKIWPQNQTPEELLQRVERFLAESRLKYVDLLLAHAPIDIEHRFEQFRSLEALKQRGLAHALGLTNLSVNQIMTFVKDAEAVQPTAYMMEVSPFRTQRDITDYCSAGGIIVINNEPVCKGSRNKHPLLVELSGQLGISTEELLFRWSVSKGFVTLIPPSAKQLRLDLNELSKPLPKEIMQRLNELDLGEEGSFLSSWAPIVEEDG